MKNLTVKDLKALLENYPDDAMIVVPDHEDGYNGIDHSYLDKVEFIRDCIFTLNDGIPIRGGKVIQVVVLE
jgi:hypothetical protein